jgi:tripartite-type tricarboxylate transporter receptor subunit TctC
MELLKSLAGLSIAHVPCKGSGPALTDAVAGQIAAEYEVYRRMVLQQKLSLD